MIYFPHFCHQLSSPHSCASPSLCNCLHSCSDLIQILKAYFSNPANSQSYKWFHQQNRVGGEQHSGSWNQWPRARTCIGSAIAEKTQQATRSTVLKFHTTIITQFKIASFKHEKKKSSLQIGTFLTKLSVAISTFCHNQFQCHTPP